MADPSPDRTPDLARLYVATAPALHAWACLRLGREDRARLAPEDLLQDVWLRAQQVFGSFDEQRCSFRAWLFTVAKHVLLEARRRLRRLSVEMAAGGSTTRQGALDRTPMEITSITRRLAKDEAIARFVTAIEGFEDVERQTVLHCGLEGMTAKEAASRLGESSDATAKRWQRLRSRMKEWSGSVDMVDP